MAKIAEGQSIIVGKVYADGILKLKGGRLKNNWMFHVAPVVFVTQSVGEPRIMVFDPSLFQKPVTIEEWASVMTDDFGRDLTESKIYFGSRFQYRDRLFEESKRSWDF